MLQVTVPKREFWDERKQEFVQFKGQALSLEHSLVSISKWESKWHKPFLGKDQKTKEEVIDYIRCMTLTQNVDPLTFECLTTDNIKIISDYISDSMTATWFPKSGSQGPVKGEIVTSELIYYWMVALNIPFECQKWHLNRLLTLVRICNEKNKPPKKMSKNAILKQNSALNAARRQRLHTKG